MLTELLDGGPIGRLTRLKHCCLEVRPWFVGNILKVLPTRLYNEMQMLWLPPCVRPQANVYLAWLENFRNDLRDFVEQRSHLCCLLVGEFP